MIEEQIGTMDTASPIENVETFKRYVRGIKHDEPILHHLNIFLQDVQHESAIFTKEEWDTLNTILGREKLMSWVYERRAGLTNKEISEIKLILKINVELE